MIIPIHYLLVHFQYKPIPKEKTLPELVFEYGNGLFFLFFQEGSLLAEQKWASGESAFFIPSAAFFGRDGVRFGCCFLSVGNILRRSIDLQMVIADVKNGA